MTLTDPDDRIRYIGFDSEKAMMDWLGTHFKLILSTGGSCLDKDLRGDCAALQSVCWINKSKTLGVTDYVKISEAGNDDEYLLPVENVRICFTGYRDTCPGGEKGASGECANLPDNQSSCKEGCKF